MNKNYEAPKAEMIEVQMPVVVMSPLAGNPDTGGGAGGSSVTGGDVDVDGN